MNDLILIGLVVAFFIAIIYIKNNKNKQANKRSKKRNDDIHEVATRELIEKAGKPLNLIESKTNTTSGIIASQEKKFNKPKKIKQNKPIGWISANSYKEDIDATQINKYIVSQSINEDINEEPLTKKDKKQQISLLFVDDSFTMLKLASNLFNKKDYDLTVKENGVLAYEHLQATPKKPDIIITDLDMPQMNGFEFIKKIKEEVSFKDIPIIVLANDIEEAITLAKQNNINGITKKPFDKKDFLEQINFILNS